MDKQSMKHLGCQIALRLNTQDFRRLEVSFMAEEISEEDYDKEKLALQKERVLILQDLQAFQEKEGVFP